MKQNKAKEIEDAHQDFEVVRADLYKQISKTTPSSAGGIYGVELALKNLTRNYSEWYSCLAGNIIGFHVSSMHLNVIMRKGKYSFSAWHMVPIFIWTTSTLLLEFLLSIRLLFYSWLYSFFIV